MNKLQLIKLLALRGILELDGLSIAQAIEESGGDPTDKEMIEVNKICMEYYMDKSYNLETELKALKEVNAKLQADSDWLGCLEAAGVDNWEGYDIAQDYRDEYLDSE